MKTLFVLLAMLPIKNTLHGTTNSTSQTFIYPRPLYTNLPPQNGPWLIFASQSKDDSGSSFQIVGATQHFTDEKKGYFGINCKETILIAGDATNLNNERDVRAEYLNLPSDYSGLLTINPTQKQKGFWLTYFQQLGNFFDSSIFSHLALVIQLPVIWIENSLNLYQPSSSIVNANDDQPHDAIQALNQTSLLFGKMFPGTRKDQGIAELRIDLRTTLINEFPFFLAAYSGFIAPTHSRVSPEYIFNPLIGINRHPALVTGANFMFPLSSEDCPWLFTFYFDAENRFYIKTTECRTFDLKNPRGCQRKQWSRYLPLRKEDEEAVVFAANLLTIPVKAKPENRANLDFGTRFYQGNFQAEVGFQLWVQGEENIAFGRPHCATETFAFTDYGIAGTGTGSASKSTIETLAPNDTEFIRLKFEDLDLRSGAAQGSSMYMIHASMSYAQSDEHSNVPFEASVGIFGENPKNNAAFKSWGLWGKAGIRF